MDRPVTPDELLRMPDGAYDERTDGVLRGNRAAVGFTPKG